MLTCLSFSFLRKRERERENKRMRENEREREREICRNNFLFKQTLSYANAIIIRRSIFCLSSYTTCSVLHISPLSIVIDQYTFEYNLSSNDLFRINIIFLSRKTFLLIDYNQRKRKKKREKRTKEKGTSISLPSKYKFNSIKKNQETPYKIRQALHCCWFSLRTSCIQYRLKGEKNISRAPKEKIIIKNIIAR